MLPEPLPGLATGRQMTGESSWLVIFDVCDTLYGCNTTAGFIHHYAASEENRRIEQTLRRWFDRGSPFFYVGAAMHRIAGYDIARKRLIASLAGETRERLKAAAGDYARRSLPSLANAEVHERLERHRASGQRIVLVSSSLDLVVEAIAELLGVEYRASILEFDDGICTGRLVRDLTGNKAAVVRDLAGSQPAHLTVYTDNRSDRGLVAMADDAMIIIPRGAAAGARWAGEASEYLKL